MSVKKLFAFFLILILILPLISLNAASSETEEENVDSSERPFLLDLLLKLRFRLGFLGNIGMGRYFVRQLRPPVPIQPYPDTISLNYLNKTTFQIGGKDPVTLEWDPLVKVGGTWDWAWMTSSVIFTFEFVPPENAEEDVFNVVFDPEKLVMKTNKENLDWPGAEQPFKTNVTIMLKPSVDPTYPTQDIVLKVNIVREEVLDKLRLLSAPKFAKTHKEEYFEKAENMGVPPYWTDINYFMYNRITKHSLFLMNAQLPSYDKWIDSTVEILVKVDKYHQVEVIPPLPLVMEPYQVKSIPVTIKNLGSHIDTFNFRVKCDDENIVVTPPPALTLKPGEEGQALVGVAAPKRFLSVGSTTSIFVEAYSVDDPEAVFSNTVILSISGIHATGGSTYNFALMIITLVITLMIILYLLRKRREKILKKPDKPWDIPEEKEYLKKLKEKDKKEYNKVFSMMDDEYQSALLWYKHYCKEMLAKYHEKISFREFAKQTIKKITSFFKMPKKIMKKKDIKKSLIKLKPEVKKAPKTKEIPSAKTAEIEQKAMIDIKAQREKIRREKLLLKIKRKQEKQRRKFKQSIH